MKYTQPQQSSANPSRPGPTVDDSDAAGQRLQTAFGCVRLADASVASVSLAGRKVATTFTPSRAPDTVRCQVKRR